MKKVLSLLLVFIGILFLSGCGKTEKNVEGSLSNLMTKVYDGAGVSHEDMETVELNSENTPFYLGDVSFSFKEGLASEPIMSSVAHSVVLIRLNSASDAEKAKKEIKEKVDPNKWVCVSVDEENVYVESIGDLVILAMDNQNGEKLKDSFLNLSK